MTVQSMLMPWPAREARAVALLTVITSSEVPTATGMENPSARTSAGTTAKPPPTPKNPVSSPTALAVTTTLTARGQSHTKRGVKAMIGSNASSDRPGAAAAVPLPGDHDGGNDQHQDRERREQDRRGDAGRQVGAVPGPGHAQDAEQQALGHPDPSGPGVGDHPGQRGDPDDDQRPGRRRDRALPQHVDQGRHGQDRAAATERAEAQPDQQPEGKGKGKHEKGSPSRSRMIRRWNAAVVALVPGRRAPADDAPRRRLS